MFVEDLRDACPETLTGKELQKMNVQIESDNENEAGKPTNGTQHHYCPIGFCNATETANRTCDFKLFVSWLGSDKNHKKLISQSERFMVYQKYNLDVLFEKILQIANPTNKYWGTDFRENTKTVKVEDLEDDVKKLIMKKQDVKWFETKHLSEI